jgi:hypothetical protein
MQNGSQERVYGVGLIQYGLEVSKAAVSVLTPTFNAYIHVVSSACVVVLVVVAFDTRLE